MGRWRAGLSGGDGFGRGQPPQQGVDGHGLWQHGRDLRQLGLKNLRRVEVDYRGRRRAVLEYDWPGQRIWGATAAILFNLRERLAGIA